MTCESNIPIEEDGSFQTGANGNYLDFGAAVTPRRRFYKNFVAEHQKYL